jgi:hypothetical protein
VLPVMVAAAQGEVLLGPDDRSAQLQPASRQIGGDHVAVQSPTFSATGASPPVNLPSIKGAGPTIPHRDRAKTSFCSDTYGPKWHQAIYRDISALVHY